MSAARPWVAPTLLCLFLPFLGCGDDADGGGGDAPTGSTTSGDTTTSSISSGGGGGGGGGAPSCGDGAVGGDEACDDGNTASDDGCDATCAVEDGWTCTGAPSVCLRLCGNGVIDAGEACDDGNGQAGDGCGKTCAEELGWTCDGEPSVCDEVCGDGVVTVGEACDDANIAPGDGCDPTCSVELGYGCEDEPSVCSVFCGDGLILPGETCDDGNNFAGDGCYFTCQVEPGFVCSGEPSVCTSILGDTCAYPAVLTIGMNTVYWGATGQEYVTAPPSCSTVAPDGPDVVMQYTATFTGEVAFTVDKPAGQRWHLLMSDEACGVLSPELLCVSDYPSATLAGTFNVTAGKTYFFYLVDSASGALPLDSAIHVTLTGAQEACGDGLVIGEEACDDGNTTPGDGCTATCEIEPGYSCAGEPSACALAVGEDCSTSIPLSAGPNTVAWTAALRDHFTTPPPCSAQGLAGPDVVMHYTATVSGELDYAIAKPAGQRWHLLVNDGTCGTTTPALACLSDFSSAALAGTLVVTAGTTYFFYLVDTTSGTLPLSNPLDVTITETAEVCGDGVIFGNEACDDGNTGSGDGCSSACEVEPGYVCQGQPSACLVPPCAPGTNGMIGDTFTTLDTDLPPFLSETHLAIDPAPDGWIYIGGLTALHRFPKAGGPNENVGSLAGLTTVNLGYTMLVDGLDLYTIEAKTTDTAGHVWRISDDGGVSWTPTDYVALPAAPGRPLQSAASHQGQLYTLTNQLLTTLPTQLYSAPLGGTAPVPATLELSFADEARCAGLALDDDYLYTACGVGDRLVRVDRTTGAVTLLTSSFNLDINANAIFAHDVDADGAADYLYFKGPEKRIGFVCDPGGASPYTGELMTYGSTSSTATFGMAFDPTTVTLYAFDDATEEVVIIR